VELEESANATLDRCRGARPVNTTRAYAPKLREFNVWCDRKGFHEITRYQVTTSQINLFLQEDVVDRKTRVKGSDRKVGVRTVEMYVNAKSDLYNDQQSRGANAHPHTRNSLIKALLGSLKREMHEKNKREYADRGIGSLLNRYCTTNELVSISRYYMNLNTGSDLRNRMSHFLCHSCLLRGKSAPNLELPDLFSVVLENEGFTESRALVMIMGQGKTNQYGRREFGLCIRHTNVEVYAVLLRIVHPKHKLWSFPPFNSSAFDIFATQLKDKIATEQAPQTTNLCALVLDLVNHLKQQQQQQTLSQIESKINEVGTSVLSIKETITQLTSVNTTVCLRVGLGGQNNSTAASEPPSYQSPFPSTYKLLRSLKTVHQVWQECPTRINGGPAVCELEERHGLSWRTNSAEKRFFFRGKCIIDRIILITQQ
ncbi:Hypothetical protein PHPALM_617, partial [Phytophthora palmivora]